VKPLVVLEERAGALTAGSYGLLAMARALWGETTALLCGGDVQELASKAAEEADLVLVAETPELAAPLPQPRVAILAQLVADHGFGVVLLENSSLAADIAAGLSARLEAGVNWDLVDLDVQDGQLIGTRLALGDAVQVTVGWSGNVRIAVMRRGVLQPGKSGAVGQVQQILPEFQERSARVKLLERVGGQDADATLDQADCVVAGGRGLRDREQLGLLEQLADALGGAVAVTMPLVDRGWYPYSHQVGQTGKTVRPRLYMACGISGAIQHRVGMENAGTIVAINTDETSPIFGFADVAVVADLHEFVPRLTELLNRRRGSVVPDPSTEGA